MRLSASDDSPFYNPELAENADVLLNGEPHFLVVEANEDDGWIDILARDRDGNYIVDGDRVRLRRVYGDVRIEIKQ